MNAFILSLLLLFFVAAGLLMRVPRSEGFTGEQAPTPPSAPAPAPASAPPPKLQVDKLARDKEIVDLAHAASLKVLQGCPSCPSCPPQKQCPDMSQYIRLDEVPCWNCSLP